MRWILSLTVAVLLAVPAVAGVKVDHEDDVEFAGFVTYAWKPGTDAARPNIQRWIVEAVERELKAAGLRKVKDRRADVYVVTHAFAEMDAKMRANYRNSVVYDVGILTSEVVLTTTGVLVVDLIVGETEQPAWRGIAKEVMLDSDLKKLQKKVNKVTHKMFKEFPPN